MRAVAERLFATATILVISCLGLATVTSAGEADFIDPPIRLVVPFTPGGGTDVIARTIAPTMSKLLKRSVVVENRPGAGSTKGSDQVAKSDPDGHTLLLATFAHAVNPLLRTTMPYDTDTAFDPVVLIGRSPNILVVRSDSPYRSVQDVLAAARANPSKLTFASHGFGTSAHLAAELFDSVGSVKTLHVPYKGAGPALNDLLGGQVDLMFATATAVAPLLESGRLRALAVTTQERSPARPDLPTMAEAGLPGYAAESWYGLYVPAGTPRELIDRLNWAATQATQTDLFAKRVREHGLTVSTGTPEDLQAYVAQEKKRWAGVVRAADITPR